MVYRIHIRISKTVSVSLWIAELWKSKVIHKTANNLEIWEKKAIKNLSIKECMTIPKTSSREKKKKAGEKTFSLSCVY